MTQKIQVGNAPCSWGTLEFEGFNQNPIGYNQMLDELVETGYTATELGDWGFMPTVPALLRKEIVDRDLRLLGAFVQAPFSLAGSREKAIGNVMRVAELLQAAFADHNPYIILSDDNATVPIRTKNAGRVTGDMELTNDDWTVFTTNVQEIARQVQGETGLRTIFHHHSAGYIETPDEISKFLDKTDPSLINLVFDTGHFVFGSGISEDNNILAALDQFAERISYFHFKDLDPVVAKKASSEEWDYFESLKHGIFCELGKGCIDFSGVVHWLNKHNYEGWVLVEQDVLPGMGDPKLCAQRNREFLRSIGL